MNDQAEPNGSVAVAPGLFRRKRDKGAPSVNRHSWGGTLEDRRDNGALGHLRDRTNFSWPRGRSGYFPPDSLLGLGSPGVGQYSVSTSIGAPKPDRKPSN